MISKILSRISLQKQLLLIFTLLTLTVLIIIFPVINNNFRIVIDEEMYSVLDSAQDSYLEYSVSTQSTTQEKQIYHLYYDSETDIGYPSLTMTREDIIAMREVFIEGLSEFVASNEEVYQGKGEYYSYDMYYQIVKIDDTNYLISIMYSDYSTDLVLSLQQQVFYIFYGAFGLIGIVLFLWVTSLIKPLQLIKKYIESIKEQEESELVIERKDEIGLVARSLTSMKEQLDIENKVQKEMIHNISHDLKTPIALIRTYSESVKDDIYPYGDKDASMDVIIENADRLDKKVRSLLHLNRLEYLGSIENMHYIQMDEVINHLSLQLQQLHPDIEIIVDLQEVTYLGEEENWRICIENIIENAYRYARKIIKITLNEETLEIYNDGPPIDLENMDDLYKPYRKGTKGQFGLGLSIVYKTVTIYGYSVEAINKEEGVSFIITKINNL
ncbi:sensor histidine kinase [Tannockella kyphosi]|uniref:sensor histidine kinase n=1 Tax=Tannockella kyphosi TaxID=2899121 RepID=UPI0020127FB5|nr:HAMP domain-containing sensor histidine kinase [Tannockella kyphosi]